VCAGGGGNLLASQITGLLCITTWVALNMFILLFILKKFGMLRISEEEERRGLDMSKHGGKVYNHEKLFDPEEMKEGKVVSSYEMPSPL